MVERVVRAAAAAARHAHLLGARDERQVLKERQGDARAWPAETRESTARECQVPPGRRREQRQTRTADSTNHTSHWVLRWSAPFDSYVRMGRMKRAERTSLSRKIARYACARVKRLWVALS